MYAGRKCRIQTLRQTTRHNQLWRNRSTCWIWLESQQSENDKDIGIPLAIYPETRYSRAILRSCRMRRARDRQRWHIAWTTDLWGFLQYISCFKQDKEQKLPSWVLFINVLASLSDHLGIVRNVDSWFTSTAGFKYVGGSRDRGLRWTRYRKCEAKWNRKLK